MNGIEKESTKNLENGNLFHNASFFMNEILFNATSITKEGDDPIIMMERVGEKEATHMRRLRVVDYSHITFETPYTKMDSTSLLAAAMAANKLGYTGSEVLVTTGQTSLKVSL